MVLCEIGEHRHPDARGIQAPFDQTDGRGLNGTGFQPVVHHVAQARLKQHRIGGRQACGHHGRAHFARQRGTSHTKRANQTARQLRGTQQLRHPPGGGRLAIGARDGDHRQGCTGVLVVCAGDCPRLRLESLHRQNALIVKGKRIHPVALNHRGRGAIGQRAAHEFTPVGGRTRPRHKAIPLAQQAAVAQQAPRHALVQPAGDVARVGEGRVQNDSSTASVTIWGLTVMSGCTPRMRKVCCTVSLKTGAATKPPKY